MSEMIKVLVVDDDQRIVKTLCDILRIRGHATVFAYTGEDAVQKVRTEMPDCVLMDIKMPKINGIEALSMIRKISPDLPVILMSAYAAEEQIQAARECGSYSVMTKPVDIQALLLFLSLLRRQECVLIVDDDPEFCSTLRDILQARGYAVDTESEPDRVLGLMEQEYKLAVLLNLKLGDYDGLEVLQSIRGRYPTKPVVMVTAYKENMKDSIENAYRIGAYTCMYKPFITEDLIVAIEEIKRKKLQNILGTLNDCRGGKA